MGIADTYDPELNLHGGYLAESLDNVDPTKRMGENGKTLLRLIYFLAYTESGRGFLRANKPSRENPAPSGRLPEDTVVATLRTKFTTEFNVTEEDVLNACVQLHLQGTYWVDENVKFGQGDASAAARREVHEKSYKTYMSVVTWQLWENGTGHEFSLGW